MSSMENIIDDMGKDNPATFNKHNPTEREYIFNNPACFNP
jgi:hypothetical protein